MLLEGNNVNNYTSQNILTCAQILVHNFIPKTKPQASISENISKRYHSQKRKIPVITYISFSIYVTVRSETLIDKLFDLELCIPYEQVLEITEYNFMTEYSFQQFELKKVFISKTFLQKLIHCHSKG